MSKTKERLYDINIIGKDLNLSPDVIKEFVLDFLHSITELSVDLEDYVHGGNETNIKEIVMDLIPTALNLRLHDIELTLNSLLDGNSIETNKKIFDELIFLVRNYILDVSEQSCKFKHILEIDNIEPEFIDILETKTETENEYVEKNRENLIEKENLQDVNNENLIDIEYELLIDFIIFSRNNCFNIEKNIVDFFNTLKDKKGKSFIINLLFKLKERDTQNISYEYIITNKQIIEMFI